MEILENELKKYTSEILLVGGFSKTQLKKMLERLETVKAQNPEEWGETFFQLIIQADNGDLSARSILEFTNRDLSEIRELKNQSLSRIKDCVYNMTVCVDSDRGYKSYIAEIACLNSFSKIPHFEITGFEVPIFENDSEILTTADLEISTSSGTSKVDIMSVTYDINRISCWNDFESFLLKKVSDKISSKLRSRTDKTLLIVPIIWGDHESLSSYKDELKTLFQGSEKFIGPFVITEFSRDGVRWYHDFQPVTVFSGTDSNLGGR